MIKRILLLALWLSCQLAYGQLSIERQLIGVTGNESQSGSLSLSASIGETVVAYATSGTLSLSQGFQQADEQPVGIGEERFELRFDVFPNPTDGVIWIQLETEKALLFEAEIYDLQGKSCGITWAEKRIQGKEKITLDLSALSAANYLLIFRQAGKNIHVVRIIKTEK